MASDFDRALDFTLAWEGGYVNDPDDPGGETNFGISKRAYPDEDIQHLTRERAAALYERDYWRAGGCHLLSWPLNLCHFDACVNHGPGRAATFLKAAKGAAKAYCDAREAFYRAIVAKRPTSQKYLKGWMNRLNTLRKLAGVA